MFNYSSFANANQCNRIVILLHGYGSNRNDLIRIAPELSHHIDNILFISPDAPFVFENTCDIERKQWFSLLNRKPNIIREALKKTGTLITKFIHDILKKNNLTENDLIILGFSQGATLGLFLLTHALIMPRALISLSGRSTLSSNSSKNIKTNILLVHGKQDEVVPIDEMYQVKDNLRKQKINIETHILNHLKHTIDNSVISVVNNFLVKQFLSS